MPKVQATPGTKAPTESYLALHVGQGELVAIPKGATMFICEIGEEPIPMMLVKVTHKMLTFRCACRNLNCSRVFKFANRPSGHHPPQFK